MEERTQDFKKLKEVLKRIPKGEFTPKDLGVLLGQYARKYDLAVSVDRYKDLNQPLNGL